jgi:hypothetical protein
MPATLRTPNVPRQKRKNGRDRIELRADPDWVEQITVYAEAWGLSVSALVRLAVNKWMGENPAPAAPEKKKGGKS